MNVGQLIKALQALNPEQEVMVLDGFNGGGFPRTINVGPRVRAITEEDADESADCEARVGESVVLMGFGCY